MSIRPFNLLHTAPIGAIDDAGLRVSHDFGNMSALPSSFTFSRTTKGWDERIREYAVDVSRLVRGVGLLHEQQRPNKCENYNAYPTTLSDFVGTGGAVLDQSTNQDASFILVEPDVLPPLKDVRRVARIVSGTGGGGGAGIRFGGTVGNLNAHSGSIWVRCGPGALCWLYIEQAASRVEYAGSEWQRIAIDNETPTLASRALTTFNAGAFGTWIDVIVPQLEEGTNTTSPIVTSGTSQIRAAERTTEPLVDFAAGSDGTIKADFTLLSDDTTVTERIVCLSDGTSNNTIQLYVDRFGGNAIRLNVIAGGAGNVNIGTVPAVVGQRHSVVASFSNGGYSIVVDGGVPETHGAEALPAVAMSQIDHACFVGGTNQLGGYLHNFTLWDVVR